MTWQEIIIGLLFMAASAYLALLLGRAFQKKDDGSCAAGCGTCSLPQHIDHMQQSRNQHART